MYDSQVKATVGLVEVSGVSFGYKPSEPVLRDVDLVLTTGANVLVGLNGAGKTTLFNLLLGDLTPTTGTVRVFDRDPNSASVEVGRVGYLPQTFGFPPAVTASDFVTYIGWLQGMSWKAASTSAISVLADVGLSDRLGTKLGELSGGMLRRVGLAQAFVNDPELVLLDEPATGLDPAQRIDIRELIIKESERRSFLIATHILDDVERLADQVVVLHGGSIAFTGSPEQLAERSTGARDGVSRYENAFLEITNAADTRRR